MTIMTTSEDLGSLPETIDTIDAGLQGSLSILVLWLGRRGYYHRGSDRTGCEGEL
jgi:hypothetical protein